MEKKLLYTLVIILSAFVIYLTLNSQHEQNQNIYGKESKGSVQIEFANRGKVLHNVRLIDKENKETQLHDILSQYPTKYYLVIVTSLNTCSTCRDQLLHMWNQLYITKNSQPILLIIAETEKISKDDWRKVKASMSGMEIEIPYYTLKEPGLLNELGVTDHQTPLSIIVSHNKKIIAVDRVIQNSTESSLNFKNFFMQLNDSKVAQ